MKAGLKAGVGLRSVPHAGRRPLILAALSALVLGACAAQTPLPAASASAAPREVPAALAAQGVERFMFTDWPGAEIPVWYIRPAGTPADAPVAFVMHGLGRDAHRYIGEWTDIAKAENMVVVVPEFSRAAFPESADYNFGGVFDGEGRPRQRTSWSFSAIERVFDAIKAREGLTAPGYALYGHSAGAQFVHRFVLLGAGTRMQRAVAANAGSYMRPLAQDQYPFGLKGAPEGQWNAARAFAAPLTILLGDADNDPNHRSLPRQPGAVVQGPHRLARGLGFYQVARAEAARLGLPFAWRCALAPGVAHDNGGMAVYAAPILSGRESPGTLPCGV